MIVCKPADPEAKGLIERAHDYLERSFLPGRSFTSPADFNTQLQDWLALVNRAIRAGAGLRARPTGSPPTRQAMLALPPVAPATGWRSSTRLPRDHYVRLDGNDYSVHPAVIGRRIEVVADLTGCGCSATGGWWPTTNGSGPGTRPSPTPSTSPRPRLLRRGGSAWCARSTETRGGGPLPGRLRHRARLDDTGGGVMATARRRPETAA